MNFGERYEIRQELGRGAMGIVYLGHDTRIDRPVALKCLTENTADLSDAVRKRFKQEILALGRLTHPNIVTIFDVGEDAATGRAYIVMEYVQGQSLSQVIRDGIESPPWLNVGVQICRALDMAHKRGIVHRDIKPANILIEADTKAVKIADFGIARMDMGGQTQTGQILGTPQYMSPEQCKGEPIDGCSDLFSVGAVLYEMVTRKRPFTGEHIAATMHQVLYTMPVAPDQCAAVSPAVSRVIMKALAKDPRERFQSGEEMAQALEAASRGVMETTPRKYASIEDEPTIMASPAGQPIQQQRKNEPTIMDAPTMMPSLAGQPVQQQRRNEPMMMDAPTEAFASGGQPVTPQRGLGKKALVGAGIVLVVAALGAWGIRYVSQPPLPVLPQPSTGKMPVPSVLPQPGIVDFSTEPSGAGIWINGERKGATPLTAELPAGSYELTLIKEGYHSVEAELTVVAGEQTPLQVNLIPKEDK